MTVVRGLEVLTGTYLGEDRELFGATVDEAIVNFAKGQPSDVAASISGLEGLLASSMTEDELDDHWIMSLHSAYDPRDDGYTYREWFAHALELLQATTPSTG